jgi:hypothetical protein
LLARSSYRSASRLKAPMYLGRRCHGITALTHLKNQINRRWPRRVFIVSRICGRNEETKLTLRRKLQEAMHTFKQAPERMNVSNKGQPLHGKSIGCKTTVRLKGREEARYRRQKAESPTYYSSLGA